MRKLINILFLLPVLYVVAVPFYLKSVTGMLHCSGVSVIVTDSVDNRLVSNNEIMDRVTGGRAAYAGVPLSQIDLSEIESKVAGSISELRTTEVYTTIDGSLYVEVAQRAPVLRLRTISGSEYYIDDEGYLIRKKGLYPPRVHVAGGRIDFRDFSGRVRHVNDEGIPAILSDLYKLVSYIREIPMLSALIDQIEVAEGDDIVLIPRTGGHKIILGDIKDMEIKFATLEAFYGQVMKEGAWDSYSLVNLKYTRQVVCRKKQ